MLVFVGPCVADLASVSCRAKEGAQQVVVVISHDALNDVFRCFADYQECAETHADEIVAAASVKYRPGMTSVTVSADDF